MNEIKEITKVKNVIYNAIDDLGDKLQDYNDDDVYATFEEFSDRITEILEEDELKQLFLAIEERRESLSE